MGRAEVEAEGPEGNDDAGNEAPFCSINVDKNVLSIGKRGHLEMI